MQAFKGFLVLVALVTCGLFTLWTCARVQWLADYYRLTRRSIYKLLADERARK